MPKKNITQETKSDPEVFLNNITDESIRKDCLSILQLMKDVTKKEPKMWGDSIIGFGNYHYKYESGREGDWFLTGFSPRKANLTIYIMAGFASYGELMKKLGKYKTGVSCLYVNKLSDIDLKVLKQLLKESIEWMKQKALARSGSGPQLRPG